MRKLHELRKDSSLRNTYIAMHTNLSLNLHLKDFSVKMIYSNNTECFSYTWGIYTVQCVKEDHASVSQQLFGLRTTLFCI